MNIAVSAPTAAGTPTELPVEVPGPGEAADLRSWLRASLAARHDHLESLPLPARMASGGAGPEDFTRYLLTQLRLTRALEPAIEPWLSPEEARARLVKGDWIAADLYALGIAPAQLHDLPVPAHPDIRSTAAALGALYVLEGSTLGLAVLGKRMRSEQSILFTRASRFLTAYGPDSGRMWKQFLASLSGLPRQGWAETQAAAAATFDLAIQLFEETSNA